MIKGPWVAAVGGLLNRCLVLTVDEGREQTRAIHDRQCHAQTLGGLLAGAKAEAVRKLHQDAQRLIEPLAVVNPHARELGSPTARSAPGGTT